jgi:Transglycosylase SLT domain
MSELTLSWDVKPERKPWSAELIRAIQGAHAELETGNPNAFIAGYDGLALDGKLLFWAELVVAMAKFESNWNPRNIFHEPPPLGVDSVGLLQLSYEDQGPYHLEPLSRESKSLEDPLVNIRCGVKILARLVSRDSVVASGSGGSSRGAARYWSVVREGHGHHKDEIKTLVRHATGL